MREFSTKRADYNLTSTTTSLLLNRFLIAFQQIKYPIQHQNIKKAKDQTHHVHLRPSSLQRLRRNCLDCARRLHQQRQPKPPSTNYQGCQNQRLWNRRVYARWALLDLELPYLFKYSEERAKIHFVSKLLLPWFQHEHTYILSFSPSMFLNVVWTQKLLAILAEDDLLALQLIPLCPSATYKSQPKFQIWSAVSGAFTTTRSLIAVAERFLTYWDYSVIVCSIG